MKRVAEELMDFEKRCNGVKQDLPLAWLKKAFFLIFIAWVNQRSAYLNPPIHPKTNSCVFRFFPCPFSIPHDSPPPRHPGETLDILISNREQDVGWGGWWW